ncbi:MAG: hypothetical protein HYY84_11170 [Deltaproteobacteria bacterium]|nr:hypothetical protein [Deltaproteobacteria bacterium]
MPIVHVHAIHPPWGKGIEKILRDVPSALGKALSCPPDDVWVYFEEVDSAKVGADCRGWKGHCPVVVIRARVRSDDAVQRGLEAVAHAVAGAFSLPIEDIWVHWVDLPPGRVFAGGAIR